MVTYLSALQKQAGNTGKVVDIANGVSAYIAKPETSNGIGIISFQDIYAYDSARHLQCADNFAALGYSVVHVDFTGPDYYQVELDMELLGKWVQTFPYSEKIAPKIQAAIDYLKSEFNITKVAACGYCWGCYNIFQACAAGSGIQATALFHPSLILNQFVDGGKEDATDLAVKISAPQLFIACANDPDFVKPGGATIKTLVESKSPKSKAVLMADMQHGFVNRGDVEDEMVQRDVKNAISMASKFFQEQLK